MSIESPAPPLPIESKQLEQDRVFFNECIAEWQSESTSPDERELAFDDIFKRLSPDIYHLVLKMGRPQEEAEETVQDTFLNFLTSYSQSYQPGSLRSLLRRIAFNKTLDKINYQKRRPTNSYIEEDPYMFERDTYRNLGRDVMRYSENSQDPSEIVEGQIETRRLIDKLPSHFRGAVALRALGLDYQEIADILDRPVGTVRSRLNRGHTIVRESILAEKESDPEQVKIAS